jgi:DNA-binding transcriptional LysR family regulator
MSRTLGRIRQALGDPVLVRSGRSMVPTPRALEVRAEVHELVERAHAVFTTGGRVDPGSLERVFTLQANDAIASVFAAPLLARIRDEAPGVTLRFVGEGPQDNRGVREGTADLELGVVHEVPADMIREPVLRDRMVAAVRAGHPLAHGPVTAERFAAADHLVISRRGRMAGPIDALLAGLGLRRRVVASAPTYTSALFILRGTDLVGLVAERQHGLFAGGLGLVTFPVPLDLEPLEISQLWHRRYAADAAHAWLRRCVREVMADASH